MQKKATTKNPGSQTKPELDTNFQRTLSSTMTC